MHPLPIAPLHRSTTFIFPYIDPIPSTIDFSQTTIEYIPISIDAHYLPIEGSQK